VAAIKVHKDRISKLLRNIGLITGAAQMTRATDYQAILNKHLKDPKQAAAYLNAALEEGDADLFTLALKNVAEAQGIDLTVFSQAPPSLEMQKILRLLADTGLVFATREEQRAS
jgi:hypothetical protein